MISPASSFPRALLVVAIAASGVVVASASCGGTLSPTSGGDAAPPPIVFPTQHRPDAVACPSVRPPSIEDAGVPMDAGFSGSCNVDSDCTQGKNGRCMRLRGPAVCTYDGCVQDSDCPNGGVCQCESTGNRCVDANCGTDGQCAGRGCSPTFDTSCGAYDGIRGYYCHTAKDTCVNDTDCKEGGPGYCAFDTTVGHWACAYAMCAG